MFSLYTEDGLPAFGGQSFDSWLEAKEWLRRNVRRRNRAKFFILEWLEKA